MSEETRKIVLIEPVKTLVNFLSIAAITKLVKVYNRLLKLEKFQVSVAQGLVNNYGIEYHNPEYSYFSLEKQEKYIKVPGQAYIPYPEKEVNAEKVFVCLHVLLLIYSKAAKEVYKSSGILDLLVTFCVVIFAAYFIVKICMGIFGVLTDIYVLPPDSDKILCYTSWLLALEILSDIHTYVQEHYISKDKYIRFLVNIWFLAIAHFLCKYHYHSWYVFEYIFCE